MQDYERAKHAHSVLQFQFNEMKESLKQSEELLNVSIFTAFTRGFIHGSPFFPHTAARLSFPASAPLCCRLGDPSAAHQTGQLC